MSKTKRMAGVPKDVLQWKLDGVYDQIEALRAQCRRQEDVTQQDEAEMGRLVAERDRLIRLLA